MPQHFQVHVWILQRLIEDFPNFWKLSCPLWEVEQVLCLTKFYASQICCQSFKYLHVFIFCSILGWPSVILPPVLGNIVECFWIYLHPLLPYFKKNQTLNHNNIESVILGSTCNAWDTFSSRWWFQILWKFFLPLAYMAAFSSQL